MDQSASCVIHVKQETIECDDATPPQTKQPGLAGKVRLLDQFCRLCLRQRSDLVPLTSRIGDMSVSDVFGVITGLEMTLEDIYPLKMCRTCMAMLDYAFVIRQNFIKSYRILKTFAISKTQPLINNLANYQSGVRATSETTAEKMLHEYQDFMNRKVTVEPHETAPELDQCVIIPQPDENPIEPPVQIKQEPELILEPEELPDSPITVAESNCHEALDERRYKCSYCDAKFKAKYNLTRHQRIHTNERPYQCLDCPKNYTTRVNLNDHIYNIHTYDGPILTCEFEGCDYSTTRKKKYYRHKANHALRFQCSQCTQRFATGRQLQRHQYFHTGVKDFQCGQCDKSFWEKRSLEDHVAGHNNDRPYACETCGKTFVSKRARTVHLLKHSAQPSFECRHCGMKFKYRTTHASHEKRHRKVAIKNDPETDVTEEVTTVETETMDSSITKKQT